MKRALAGVFLATLVVLGLPVTSDAAADTPVVSVPSTSYSGQPRPYVVTVFNRLDNSRLTATITNSGTGTRSMSCKPAGAILGLGTWHCSTSSRLGLGSIRVTATARSGSKSRSGSGSGNVSSRFGISGHTSTVNEGGPFTVSGTYDGSGFGVSARVTQNGSVVGGQSSSSCSTSGSSFTCSLRASSSISGTSATHSITVTESGGGGSRSASTSVTVLGKGAPSSPSFSSARIIKSAAQPATITGSANAGYLVQVLVDPKGSRNWGSPAATCTASGSGTWSCTLSKSLKPGKHSIVARTIDPADSTRISPESSFTLTIQKPKKAQPEQPVITPTPSPVVPPEEPPVEPKPEPKPVVKSGPVPGGRNNVLELLVLALAVLTLARPGALTRLRKTSSASFTDRNPATDPPELESVGWGDQSPTWAAFGTDATDYWSRTAPPIIARFSPFLGRLSIDGVAIRAMFGSLWWLLPLGGGALGIAAAKQTGFEAVPPSLGLLAGILVIGCFDAFAGFIASLAFTVCVAGDLDKHGLAVVVGLGFLWTAMPLIAALIRPIRRVGHGWTYRWDRLADLVIAAMLCGWVAQRLAGGMDALAGAATGVPADADKIGLIALAAIAGRVLLGQIVDLGFPERLRATEGFEDMPEPGLYASVLGFFIRLVLFGIVGYAVIGSCWQLWAGLLLFALPDLLAGLRTRSALAPTLRTGLPAGVTQVLVLVVWGSLLVAFAISKADGDLAKVKMAFIAAAVLPSVFGLAQVLADPDAERPKTSWRLQLVGLAVVVATAALALHGWNY